MNRLDTVMNEAKGIAEARIVPWEDIYMPLMKMNAFSTDDLTKVKQQLFSGSYNDRTPVGTADFLRVVERIFGRMSKQFVQAVHYFKTKGWECLSEVNPGPGTLALFKADSSLKPLGDPLFTWPAGRGQDKEAIDFFNQFVKSRPGPYVLLDWEGNPVKARR